MTLFMTVSGFGDLYTQFFNAIVMTFGTATYKTLMRVTILLAGFTVLTSLMLRRDILSVAKWLFYFYLIIYVAFTPKVSLEIYDRINHRPNRVDHLPLGLGLIASVSSNVSDALTQLLEMSFTEPDDSSHAESLPADLTYSHNGMVFSAQVMRATTQFEITDPHLNANMQSFIQQCVFYDIRFHKYSLNDIVTNKDIWKFLGEQKMSPVRGFLYQKKDNSTEMLTCDKAKPLLDNDWKETLPIAAKFFGERLFANNPTPAAALTKYLPVGYGFLTKLGETQSDTLMKQMMMSNAIERGVMHMGAQANADAAIKAYSFVRAQAQKRLTNKTVTELACYWLPLIKVELELILYASFIFVILIAIFPFGQRTLKGYLSTLVWVQLWPPIFAFFHLIASYHGRNEIGVAVSSGLTMQTMSSLAQLTDDMISLAGYMSMSVPAAAGLVLWGAQQTFAQLSSYTGGVIQSASSQAATELASGNISLGNTSFSNHSGFNTSMNKYDTNMRVAGGSSSLQLADSSQLTRTLDGNSVLNMQNAISQTGVNLELQESRRAIFNRQAEHAESAALSNAHAFGHSLTASSRGVNALAHHYSETSGNSASWGQSASGGFNHAISEIEKVNNEIQKRTGLSHQESEALSSQIYAEAKGNFAFGLPGGKAKGLSFGVGGGGSRTSSKSDSNFSDHNRSIAKSVMDAHHYTENVDIVSRSVQDKSFRTGSEAGDRLVADINSSLDRADYARNEYNANRQKADYYRDSASLSNEKGIGTRQNLSNEFNEYVARQPNQNHTGSIGLSNVNTILRDPHLRAQYIDGFIREQATAIDKNWQHHLPTSSSAINHVNKKHLAQIGDDRNVEAVHQSNTYLLHRKASERNLQPEQKPDDSIKHSVENRIKDAAFAVHDEKQVVHGEKEKETAENNDVMGHYERKGNFNRMVWGTQNPEENSK